MNTTVRFSEKREGTHSDTTFAFDPTSTASFAQYSVPDLAPLSASRRVKGATTNKKIESAVYSYIQAVRALGKTRTDTGEIARALGLTMTEVEQTLSALTKKGVKIL